jgi:hypothetical protein
LAVVGADISIVVFGWRLESDTMIGGLSRNKPERVVDAGKSWLGVPDALNFTPVLV